MSPSTGRHARILVVILPTVIYGCYTWHWINKKDGIRLHPNPSPKERELAYKPYWSALNICTKTIVD